MQDELVELKARHERLRLLYQVATVIHSTLEPQEALELIVREAVNITRATSGSGPALSAAPLPFCARKAAIAAPAAVIRNAVKFLIYKYIF